jgi:hypothetical protein
VRAERVEGGGPMGFFDTVKEQAQELRGRVEHKVEDVR